MGRHPRDCGGPGDCPLCDATLADREEAGLRRSSEFETSHQRRAAFTAAERRYEAMAYGEQP